MKTIGWKPEPKGPGRAFHTFLDAHGERVELLAYDCPPSSGFQRMCGFEVYGRVGRKFHEQVAAGEADSLDAAMRAAEEMVARRRSEWSVLPRSWVQCGAVAAQSS